MKNKLGILVSILLITALLLSACGGDQLKPAESLAQGDETTVAAAQSETTQGASQAPAEPQKAAPSVLRIGITREPDSTSPFIATLSSHEIIDNHIYDDLMEYDDDLNIVGGLAKDWTVSEDGLVWTFNLKEGIKWTDGEDFTADDVVWTYNALINEEYPQSVQLSGITKAEKVDDYTVKIYTDQPKADMEGIRISIMPEHIYKDKSLEDLHTFAEELPVGTGPYKLVEWEQGQYLKFVANKDYFGGTPQVDELVYVVFANADTQMSALTTGEIDAATSVVNNQIPMLEQNPDIEVVKALGVRFTELGFNCWDDPQSKGNPLILDPKIRVAADYAIDKEKIVKIALNGLGTTGTSMIPPATGVWHWDPGEEEHKFDPEKAKQILEEAGYTDKDGDGIREDAAGNKLDFRFAVITSYGEAYVKAAGIIQKNLQDIGINTTINTMDGGAQSDLIYEQDFNTDMYLWGWSAELDPSLKLSVMLTEQVGKRSDCFWSNPAYDELYTKQVHQIDKAERIKTVHQMQKLIYDEAPYIILYNRNAIEAYRTDKFEGWTKVPSKIGTTITQVNKSNFLSVKPK